MMPVSAPTPAPRSAACPGRRPAAAAMPPASTPAPTPAAVPFSSGVSPLHALNKSEVETAQAANRMVREFMERDATGEVTD